MAPYLFLALVIIPIMEIAVFIKVGGVIGIGPTILLVIAISVFGVWHLKRQGLSTLASAQAAINRGEPPVREVVDGAILALAALMMILPGLVTDALGLLLLIPALRRALAGLFTRHHPSVHREPGSHARSSQIIEGVAWEVKTENRDDHQRDQAEISGASEADGEPPRNKT